MRREAWRILLTGLLVGVLLSVMRAPAGLDLARVPAIDGPTAALFRAAALIAVAAVLGRAARLFDRGVPIPLLLAAVAAGFALEGLVGLEPYGPESRLGFALVLAAGTASAFLVARRPASAPAEDDPDEVAEAPRLAEWSGLVVAAAGTALALEAVAHHVRLLGMGQPEEDTITALVVLAFLAVGAQAFGAPLAQRTRRAPGLLLATGLPLAALACFASVEVLHGFEDPAVFETYLRRFGSDFTEVGMLGTTALLAAVTFVAPGFVAGAALAGARQRTRLAAVALGAAGGIGLRPLVVGLTAGAPVGFGELVHDAFAWRSVATGAVIAASGGALALLGARRATGRPPLVALAAVALAVVVVFVLPRRTVWILSPWNRAPVEPELLAQTPHGLLTVEIARDGTRVVTLDRSRLTPSGAQEPVDAACLEATWSLVPPKLRDGRPLRVLLIGCPTPGRMFALERLGVEAVDRCVPWGEHAELVERLLFDDAPPAGERRTPTEAKARIAAGEYDVVVAPPTFGYLVFPRSAQVLPRAPAAGAATAGLDVPEGTIAVAWLDAGSGLAPRDLGERALLASDGLADPFVGVVLGTRVDQASGVAPGPPVRRSSRLAFLRRRAEARADAARGELFGRMARDGGGPERALALGLHLHYAAQRPSSPFESAEQQTELDRDALAALQRAAEAAPPSVFLRGFWEGMARLLVGKRMPDLVLAHVEPIAERHRPWPELDRLVGAAYNEFGMPAEASRFLQRAVAADPYDLDLFLDCAATLGRAGDHDRAAHHLRAALVLQPGRPDVERLLAIALVRAGDPEGRERVEALLAEDPGDEELRDLLLPGARPGPESVFPPVSGGAHDHDHE